jgi:hypothetical protein
MKRELYDIWEDKTFATRPWLVQLVDYVAHFATEAQAQRYVTAIKTERKRLGLK